MRIRQRHKPSGEYATELTEFEQRLLTGLVAVVAADHEGAAPAARGASAVGPDPRGGRGGWPRPCGRGGRGGHCAGRRRRAAGGPGSGRWWRSANAAELGALAAKAARDVPGPSPKPASGCTSRP